MLRCLRCAHTSPSTAESLAQRGSRSAQQYMSPAAFVRTVQGRDHNKQSAQSPVAGLGRAPTRGDPHGIKWTTIFEEIDAMRSAPSFHPSQVFWLCLVVGTVCISCEKEGQTGPQGPAGASGADGNATIQVLSFPDPPSSAWQSHGTFDQPGFEYSTTLPIAAIDAAILDHGSISVFLTAIQNADTSQSMLPFTDYGQVWFPSWWFEVAAGSLTLHNANVNGPTYNPGSYYLNDSLGFKVVILSGD